MHLLFLILFYIAHNAMVLAYLFLFVLFAELGSPIYPVDFLHVELKDELLEHAGMLKHEEIKQKNIHGWEAAA